MIHGIGTDICRVPRIAEALARQGERFAWRVLGPDEMEVFRERSARNPVRGVRYLATRFAAKEAFSKALGLGLRPPMTWPAAQLLNDALGKPCIVCGGDLKQYMEHNRLAAQVSVSDEEEYAVAFVIVEKLDE
ncbi:holo-ACP synthase [Massilia sp. METH4]|uniref:holo-ACP synthase n=1 Tax=Massilia sp. METH4 TaxID=3123041 RepID=UPI0030D04380